MWTPDNWTNSNQWSSDNRSLNGMERMTDDESDMHGNGRGLKTSNCSRINLSKIHNKWVISNNQNSPFQDMIGLKMWSWTSATHDNMNQIQVCLTSKMSEVFVGKGSKACNWLCRRRGIYFDWPSSYMKQIWKLLTIHTFTEYEECLKPVQTSSSSKILKGHPRTNFTFIIITIYSPLLESFS